MAKVMLRSGRPCEHPHNHHGCDELASVPRAPLAEYFQLVLHTETGPVPYSGIDNERGYAAADNLGKRHMAAGTIRTYAILSDATYAASYDDEGYTDDRFALPQMVLSHALAEYEKRYCVADHILQRMGDVLISARRATPVSDPRQGQR